MKADLYEEKARGISQLFLAIPINLDFIQGELTMEEHRENKTAGDCQLDADIKETLLNHLDKHGPVSLLTSAKFAQYAGCFLEEIERAIVAESALITPDTGDLTEKQEAPPTPADEATESPAAVRVRLQSRRRITRYRPGRS